MPCNAKPPALPCPSSPRAELVQQFRQLRRDLSALSYLPEDKTGILAVTVSRLAARLKVGGREGDMRG